MWQMRRGKTLGAARCGHRAHLRSRQGAGIVAALLIALLAGALPARAGTGRDDRDPQAYLNLANDLAYASVGRFDITKWEPGFTGSGTLVGGQWVLTAAHLFDNAASVQFNIGGKAYGVSGWVNNPKWHGEVREGYDLALVKLSEPVAGINPVQVYTGRREAGVVATFVGYGKAGNGATGAGAYDGLKRAGTNTIDGSLGKGSFTHNATFVSKLPKNSPVFLTDFDNPGDARDNVIGAPAPTDMEFLISPGDSGGGAFADFGDGRGNVLVGVHSFAEIPDGTDDSDYGDVSGHMRVSRSAKWIRQVVRRDAAGRPPRLATAGLAPVWAVDSSLRQLAPTELASTEIIAPTASAVPEPSSAMVAAALAAATLLRRQSRPR
jgi:hypothetical protein